MYKLINSRNNVAVGVYRFSDETSIPFDPDNTDYQAYLKWVALGNTPDPAENT
jgi:hypothetical protein